jgi:UDP-N-acetylmuramoyl-L-alanine---L-glutamate ligase
MRIQELNGQKVCIIGFGVEGQAAVAALQKYAPKAQITVADSRIDIDTLPGLEWQLGQKYLEGLERYDVVIKSPIMPYRSFAPEIQRKLTSSTQIFLDTVHAAGAMTVGVTGSKGKSTTTSLIAELLVAGGKKAHLVGNIGIPALEFLGEAGPSTIFAIEMSGHQLDQLTTSPHIAVMTSFFPEHLDFFPSLEVYFEAKATIGKYQGGGDWFYYNAHSPECRKAAGLSGAEHKVEFGPDDCPVDIRDTKLLGRHNAGNMGAAYLVARQLGVAASTCIEVLKSFKGLPHRLELLGRYHGIDWVDDAISTTAESAIMAMAALKGRLGTMILGGTDRNNSFDELAKAIVDSEVGAVILYGETGSKIHAALRQALKAHPRDLIIEPAATMAEVITIAKRVTPPGRTCLLSPASASYDMYKHFEYKGDDFAAHIRA